MSFGCFVRSASIFVGLLLPCSANAANISVADDHRGIPSVYIEGEILPTDAELFLLLMRRAEAPLTQVYLNSPGGDVAAALNIGRRIRAIGATTILFFQTECSSSCALIYVAGVRRLPFPFNDPRLGPEHLARLGLHRPYLMQDPATQFPDEATVRSIYEATEAYLREMNITPSFFEIMMNTPPSDVRYLQGEEVYSIVPEEDPFYDEVTTSWQARRYGIDTDTYRRRMHETDLVIDRECHNRGMTTEELVGCNLRFADATLWGVSVEQLAAFDEARTEACQRTAEDRAAERDHVLRGFRQALETAVSDQWRWKNNYPSRIAQEVCLQELMWR